MAAGRTHSGVRRRRLRHAVFLVVAAEFALAPCAHAYFEGALLSSRSASLGGSFVAIADDPSAVIDNPAGLSGIRPPSLLATYQKPYGVEGLDESFVALSVRAPWFTAGVGWFHRGLADALSETRMTLAIARDLKRTSEDASLSIGASVDVVGVSAYEAIDANDTAVAVGAGVLLRPFAFIGLGYNVRNLNEPSLDLVPGGGDTPLLRSQAIGLSYYWQERLTVTAEWFEQASRWSTRGGVELRLGPYVTLRGGLEAARAAAGVGLVWRSVGLDAGFLSHEALGQSYIVTFRYTRKEAPIPYAP